MNIIHFDKPVTQFCRNSWVTYLNREMRQAVGPVAPSTAPVKKPSTYFFRFSGKARRSPRGG